MHRMFPVKISELNCFLTCPLCKGYLIDSYTINECLHSFCKSCIFKYVKRKECCPVCKITIMKERMNLFLKRDINLQYTVYKLVPNLFKNEMMRRQTFYSTRPKAVKFLKKCGIYDKESLGLLDEDFFISDNFNEISLSIEYSDTGLSEICDSLRVKEMDPPNPKIYLQCPANLTIQLLKKFLRLKDKIGCKKQIEIMYDDKPLNKEFTLLDVAYIYAWRRTAPMRLFYRLVEIQTQEEAKKDPISNDTVVLNKIENKIDDYIASKVLRKSVNNLNESSINNENNENKATEETKVDTSLSLPNGKENEEQNNSTRTATTATLTDNLTITAMVASIAVQNKEIKQQQQQQTEEIISTKQENIAIVSNCDKENEKTEPLNASSESQLETKQITIEMLVNNGINKSKAVRKQPTKKKENNNNNNNPEGVEPGVKKIRIAKAKAPLKEKKKPDKEEKETIATTSETSNHHQQPQHQQQNPFLNQVFHPQSQPHVSQFTLPFANKLNSHPTQGVNQIMPPNFQLLPMSTLMNHFINNSNQTNTNCNSKQSETYTSWKPSQPQQQQQQPTPISLESNPVQTNFNNGNTATNFITDLNKQAQVAANALLNQKFNPALFEYFQSKAAAAAAAAAAAHSLSHNNSQHSYFNPSNFMPHQQQQQSHFVNAYQTSQKYLDDFKKPLINSFSSFIQDLSNVKSASHHTTSNNYGTELFRNLNDFAKHNEQQNCHLMQQQNCSSSSSTCSSDSSGLDSLKETGLRISESCNLVNESS